MAPRLVGRLSPYSVPVLVFALVAAVALVVPLVVAGTIPVDKAYFFTFLILILAVTYSVPYAAVVAVGTLPLLRTGIVGYASPESSSAVSQSSVVGVAVRHVVVGFLYALSSAFVGSVFIGAGFAGLSLGAWFGVPSGAVVGGLVVGGAFVALQMWRYRTLGVALDRRTTSATAVLGVLLALSPVVAYWLFGGMAPGR